MRVSTIPHSPHKKKTLTALLLLSFLWFTSYGNATPAVIMSCNSNVQVSVDENCSALIIPDMILEGNYPSFDIFTVSVYNGINEIGNEVGVEEIGLNLQVLVTNETTGSSCWGSIQVEDKLAPVFDCPGEALQVACNTPAALFPVPPATDNCDGPLQPTMAAEQIEDFDCSESLDGILRRYSRTWVATDSHGNTSAPCIQTIELTSPSLEEIVFPPNYDDEDVAAIPCPQSFPGNWNTGVPTLNGLPVEVTLCPVSVTYQDLFIEGCGASFKVVRTWMVFDWCSASSPGVNPRTHVQIIKIKDDEAPAIVCPATLTFSANSPDCTMVNQIPAADISDNCSDFTVTTAIGNAYFDGNGGFLNGLALGEYTLTYTATDACGNASACEVAVQVVDDVAPVALCIEFTVTSLDAVGLAVLPAEVFDNGSYDYCTPVSFLARRMDTVDPFSPTVEFYCSDVGQQVMVVLEVSDLNGNSNTCMIEVGVEDKLAPEILCPSNIVISCLDDYTDLNITGSPVVNDPCGTDLEVSSQETLDLCGVGSVSRTFIVTDPSGNSSSCQQTITLEDTDPFTGSNINWPADYEAISCEDMLELHPDSLPNSPINYGPPTFTHNSCSLLAINYEDQYFDVSDTACFKIVRTWQVLDWCQYDPATGQGLWTHVQTIKVVDNTPPEVFCSFSPFMKLTDPECFGTVFLEEPLVTDCSPEITITATSDLGEGFGPFHNVPPGVYEVVYFVTDQCGNFTACDYTLQVVDAKNPTPVCINGLVVEIMQTGMIDVPAIIFNHSSYDNCTAPEDLLFSYSFDVSDTIRTFTCGNGGPNNVELWVTDEYGNQDFCAITLFVQDNMGACVGVPISLGGTLNTASGLVPPVTEVSLSGTMSSITWSGSTGQYLFEEIENGGDYTVSPYNNSNPLQGVTTFDLVLLSRHILGVQPITDPYLLIAADANGSGSITTADILEVRKVILQMQPNFTSNTSWRFIPQSYVFPNPANPFTPAFPEVLNYNNLEEDELFANFMAVKIGDVNATASGNALSGDNLGQREHAVWSMPMADQKLEAGSIHWLPVRLDAPMSVLGYQFALQTNPEQLELLDVLPGKAAQSEHFSLVHPGLLTASWFNLEGSEEAELFLIQVQAHQPCSLREALWLSEDAPLLAEAYDLQDGLHSLELSFRADAAQGLIFEPVRPNPFREGTSLEFSLSEDMEVDIRIQDLTGRVIWQQAFTGSAGAHQLQLDASIFLSSGLYFCQIEAGGVVASQKLIRL